MSDITTDFIKATNRILAKVATILTHVEVIEGDVKLIREQVIEETDKPASGKQANNTDTERQTSVSTLNATQAKRQTEQTEHQENSFLRRQFERWRKKLKKPAFQLEVAAVLGLVLYTCETHRTNNLTQQNLDLTRNSIAGEIVIGDWKFSSAPIAGKPISVRAPLTNIGHAPTLYGFNAMVFRWTDLPGGDIPLETPALDTVMEPNIPTVEVVSEGQVTTEEFIYGIPYGKELRSNFSTHHLEPPLPRPTVFFIGRLVFESLGAKHETQFCFYLIHTDDYVPASLADTGDPRFIFMNCPKWHGRIY